MVKWTTANQEIQAVVIVISIDSQINYLMTMVVYLNK